MSRILSIQNLSVSFVSGEETVRAVTDVSFDLFEDEVLTLVGETGCGKSIIAHAISGLLPPDAVVSGEIQYKEKDLQSIPEEERVLLRGCEIGIVLQNPSRALNPLYTIGHQIRETILRHTKKSKEESDGMVAGALRRMGFSHPDIEMKRYPFESSGGMNQRFVIASSTILSPDLLIADEPTTGLDRSRIQDVIIEFERIMKEEEIAIILITHDLAVARRLADRVGIMYAGEVVEMGDAESIFEEPFHPYTKGLFGSLPENGCVPIPGVSPPMSRPIPGCRFHPRCSKRMEICEREHPEPGMIGDRFVRCHLCHLQ
ncbi:peptide/nickel transport system ATP-binding protein [Methanocalculus alkaliphilus]|uniref:ABC transporter ATP-binding protein n=1 Tax=Methanocalculus alkaliphilus TaxID=768730 RepID=UPI00209E75D4|nr:ABC transporter ATP-binding protein [Methanocalculus alkaliphilus]MCP1714480.1 peptide/nickel transport system ATP-binding protein [Methanocalculus alkaliphilus]